MYKEWPFFQSTIDLIEMVLAKADIPIAKHYDEQLVSESRRGLGSELRKELLTTEKYVLVISGHEKLSENNQPESEEADREQTSVSESNEHAAG